MLRRATIPRLLAVALLCSTSLSAQSVERAIPYRPNASADQRLDLHTPGSRGVPVVLFVHGGSLHEVGERRSSPMYEGVCPGLVMRGLVCATMDYRLAPTHKWPAMPDDIAAAIRWLRDSVEARGGDASHIIVAGHSSGCHLAALVGLDSTYLAAHGMHPRQLAGIVAMGCTLAPWDTVGRRVPLAALQQAFDRDKDEVLIYGTLAWRLRANPTRWIGPEAPPFLVLVASTERFFPSMLEEAAAFVRRLREAGRPADLSILDGRRHVTTTTDFTRSTDPVANLVAAFARDPVTTVTTP